MKKKIIVLYVLSLASVLLAALPMENIGGYNIILVHGAADRWTIPIAPQTYFD